MSDECTALFVDILGFEALIERYPDTVGARSTAQDNRQETVTSPSSQQYGRFFAGILTKLIKHETDLRVMVFSDCAFLVSPGQGSALRAALFATALIRTCLWNRVPVRIGLARGSFNPIRTTTDEYDGNVISRSMFTGTSITRAARAEGNPVKGMRVFLHPSMEPELPRIAGRVRVLPLAKPSPRAKWELDLLHQGPAMDGKPPEALDLRLFQAVAEMKRPEMTARVRRHYTQTHAAMNLMREANGRKPVGSRRHWSA